MSKAMIAVRALVRSHPGIDPADLQRNLEQAGFSSDDILAAVDRLWDQGSIRLSGYDLKLYPGKL